MSRPAHLPDYANPPLNEVVLGIQFAPPRGYQQIYAREVWQLFEAKFPLVEERETLPPMLETFGAVQASHINFGIITGAMHDRFWFLSEKKEELIQFQQDRFLHNWRKIGDGNNPYPRFETMIENFEGELASLEKYLSKFSSETLNINQCELTYINHIPLGDKGTEGSTVDAWLKLVSLEQMPIDDFTFGYRQVIRDSQGKPFARLSCETNTATTKKDKSMIVLNITVRGAPQSSVAASAITFLKESRERIVTCFDEMTTDFAHNIWKRK